MLVGMVTVLLTPEPAVPAAAWRRPGGTRGERIAAGSARAIVDAVRSISCSAAPGLRSSSSSCSTSSARRWPAPCRTRSISELGFTKDEVANIAKIFGVVATLSGVAIGGVLVARIGVFRALLDRRHRCRRCRNLHVHRCRSGPGTMTPMLAVSIVGENFTGGMALGRVRRLSLEPVQPRLHGDAIRAVVVAGGRAGAVSLGAGRLDRRSFRLDPVLPPGDAGLPAEPLSTGVADAARRHRCAGGGIAGRIGPVCHQGGPCNSRVCLPGAGSRGCKGNR